MSNGSKLPGDDYATGVGVHAQDMAYLRRLQTREDEMRAKDAQACCGSANVNVAARRLTARELLDREIIRLEQQAGALRHLSASLPLELPYPADQVLCDMILALGRRA